MAHAKYQVEVWHTGGLVIRSEITDDVERAKHMAREMMEAMGERYSVRVMRDGETFYAYEWDRL
jgi:hypothetical protein